MKEEARSHDQPAGPVDLTRRAFLRVSLVLPSAVALNACAQQRAPVDREASTASTAAPSPDAPAATAAQHAAPATAAPQPPGPTSAGQTLAPTPACADDDEPTIAQTEGPYFTPNSPERSSLLEPGVTGSRMLLQGAVLTTDCQPVAQALVDFWHADDAGVYDNAGYTLRGHQYTDAAGRYQLETVVPGLYPGRTRHFHVKVQAPGQPVLTTQLYFPDEPANGQDGLFDPALLIAVQQARESISATFNFVLQLA